MSPRPLTAAVLRTPSQDPMHFAAIGSRAIERIAHNVSAVSEADGRASLI